jgi:hydroxyacylglutathione hydrolase
MFLKTIKSEGLAHLSYILGDGNQAAVIDPSRDCDIYVDMANEEECRITHIFETHRNEDYIIGSIPLSEKTGAKIYHGSALSFKYGQSVKEGDSFQLGNLELNVLETPGHTYESISLVLKDLEFGKNPVAVFTGDALFIGDVGRTDFFPDKADEVAGLLYDSIFNKLLPLGEQVILYPAHGAGSVCGSGMASREFSTLGYEQKNNPVLQKTDRKVFIEHKKSEHHYIPPYFKMMEKYNLEGPPSSDEWSTLSPLTAEDLAKAMDKGSVILDTRSPEAIAGAFIQGSYCIPLNMIPAFAGWFLTHDQSIVLIVEQYEQVDTAVRFLYRLGYDHIEGFMSGGLHEWETSGRQYDRIPTVHASEIAKRIEAGQDFTLLDVRSKEEFDSGHLPGAVHCYLGELPDHLDRVPQGPPVTTFCGSGRRAVIAASILKKNGFTVVEDCLGSMSACKSIGCKIVREV